jgi:hypothetical protein
MNIIAKFVVTSVERQGDYSGTGNVTGIKVNASPVYAPNDLESENGKFWTATPNGQLWMQINNPECFDFFKAGEFIYLTFTQAASPAVAGSGESS